MGLNLRNESNSVPHNSRETRYRVWWAVYLLHISLCVMTGRFPSSTEDSCTTPLPVPFAEKDFSQSEVDQLIGDHEARVLFMRNLVLPASAQMAEKAVLPESEARQSSIHAQHVGQIASAAAQVLAPNAPLHFLHYVELGLIARRSVDALYAPGAGRKSWRSIEMVISALCSRADAWLSKLPAEFHFTQGAPACERERLHLAFSFYSTKIVVTQPCLSRILLQATFDDQAETFCATMAAMCVDMACQLIQLLPDTPDLTLIYELAPWWCIVHFIMQAITTILISLFIKEKTHTVQHPKAIDNVSKAADWLASLAEKDASAQRAWAAIQDLLSHREIEAAMKSRNSD